MLLTIRLSFWMLGFASWYGGHDSLNTLIFYFPFNTRAFIGPCLYFYFLSLTNRDFSPSRGYWPHLALPILLLYSYIGRFAMDLKTKNIKF